MKLPTLLARSTSSSDDNPALTLATLFDDVIDAERVLMQLRRSQIPPSTTSVILRERVLHENDPINPYRAVLSEVVARSSLEAASTWLEGLASLILPDRAQYLSAGPVGQILSTIRDTMQTIENEHTVPGERSEIRQLSDTFRLFGFERDEARYIEQRIVVGSAFIAVTTTNTQQLRNVHRMLTRSMPVYMGLAKTDTTIYRRAQELLETGPRIPGAVVIADAISPLDHVGAIANLVGTSRDVRGKSIRSKYGETIGRVEDVLYEPHPAEDAWKGPLSDDAYALRYILVRPDRRSGMGRKLLPLPNDRIIYEGGALTANVTHEELVRAPRSEPSSEMSRQDEAAIRRHFTSPFYWLDEAE